MHIISKNTFINRYTYNYVQTYYRNKIKNQNFKKQDLMEIWNIREISQF